MPEIVELLESCEVGFHALLKDHGIENQKCFVDPDNRIIVPMRRASSSDEFESDDLTHALAIDADNRVQYVPDNDFDSAHHMLGDHEATVRWYCANYFEGISIVQVLRELHRRDSVVVCGSHRNIIKTSEAYGDHERENTGYYVSDYRHWQCMECGARFLQKFRPGRTCIVCHSHSLAPPPGLLHGHLSNLRVLTCPIHGDINSLVQKHGLRRVADYFHRHLNRWLS